VVHQQVAGDGRAVVERQAGQGGVDQRAVHGHAVLVPDRHGQVGLAGLVDALVGGGAPGGGGVAADVGVLRLRQRDLAEAGGGVGERDAADVHGLESAAEVDVHLRAAGGVGLGGGERQVDARPGGRGGEAVAADDRERAADLLRPEVHDGRRVGRVGAADP